VPNASTGCRWTKWRAGFGAFSLCSRWPTQREKKSRFATYLTTRSLSQVVSRNYVRRETIGDGRRPAFRMDDEMTARTFHDEPFETRWRVYIRTRFFHLSSHHRRPSASVAQAAPLGRSSSRLFVIIMLFPREVY
jgi:hypothetical protein